MKRNLKTILISLIASIIVFISLLFVQKNILQPNGTATFVVATKEIEEGTLITIDNVSQYFKEETGDGKFKVSNSIGNKKDLVGFIANNYIDKASVVSKKNFTSKESVLSDIKEPVECSVAISSFSQAVSGTVREGDLINISVINETTKKNEQVLANVYVNKAYTSDGREIKRGEELPAVSINLILSKKDEKTLNDSLKKGDIRISKVSIENAK